MTIKYLLIFIIILFLWNNASAQQDLAEHKNISAWQDDLVGTERLYYNAKDDTSKQLLLLHKYELNIKLEQFDEAEISLNRINTSFLPLERKQEWYAEKAFLELLFTHYDSCIHYTKLGLQLKGTMNAGRLLQSEVLSYIMMADTKSAISELTNWADIVHLSPDSVSYYRSLLNSVVWKDPDKARRKSRIIPGIGQWYAGGKRDAIINTALLLLTAGGTIFLFAKGYILTPAISGAGLFLRFYIGGRKHAVALANKFNTREKEYLFKTFRLLFLRYS